MELKEVLVSMKEPDIEYFFSFAKNTTKQFFFGNVFET